MSVVGSVAAAATFYFTGGNAQAAMAAYSIGSGVEAIVNAPDTYGPRLEDLKVQMSSYGAPIPYEWGINRHAGTIIWPREIEAKEGKHSESAKGGPDAVSYTYSLSLAVLVCEGPIAGIRRIWANKKIIYDVSEGNTGKTKDPALGGLRIYLGTEDQEVDPLIEATEGPSPAYLGLVYVVFEDYDVTDTQGRPPQFEFEVVTEGEASQQPAKRLGDGGTTLLYTNPSTDEQSLWSVVDDQVFVYGLPDETLLATITLPFKGTSITTMLGRIWVGHSESAATAAARAATAINPITYAIIESTMFGYLGAVSRIGTVVSDGFNLYAFVNEGIGWGALRYPDLTASGITVPNYVYQALEMRDLRKAALTGNGNWMVIANLVTDLTDALIENPDWNGGGGHRMARDVGRNCLYWAVVGKPNVYRVSLDTYELELLIDIASVQGMHYNSADDTIYVDLSSGALNAYSPSSGALSGTIPGAGVLTSGLYGNAIDVGSSEYYYVSETGDTPSVWRINLKGALAPSKIPLSQIVSDICTMKDGLSPAEIDVTALTPLVDGYILSRQMTRRAGIEALMPIYQFDAVDNGGTLQFVMRGGGVAATIPEEDRAARDFGSDLPDGLTIVRAQDLELPYEVELEYPDVDADHLIGAQYSRRITKDTKQKTNMQTAVVMTAELAKKVTAVNLYDAWLQTSFRWTTTRKYSHLLPTDVVELPTKEALYRGRILSKREQPSGIIEWEAKAESVDVYTQSGAGAAPTNYVNQSVFTPGHTALELLDIPLLRDQDAGKGFPVAMAGTSASWPGAQLFKSSGNGSTYDPLYSQSDAAVIGTATTALADFTGGDGVDAVNAVTVKIGPGGQLVSYSDAQVAAGSGAFALGINGRWEILQYRTATLTAPLTYELTGLSRGLRGTEWAAGTHQAGDRFVLLNAGGIRYYDPGTADANVQRLYKAPAFRATLSSAAAVPFTDTLVRLRPYSVASLTVEDTGNAHLITWEHRSIIGGAGAPLDATFVAFDVSILKLDGSVMKTYSVAEESFTYTDVDAFNDFGEVPGDFLVRVAQRNSDYGQGIGVTVAVSGAAPSYDVPPPQTDPGTDPGESTGGGNGTPAPGTNDAWQFVSYNHFLREELGSDGAIATLGVYSTTVWASATHVAYFGGTKIKQYNTAGGAYFTEANPDAYVWNRATSTLTHAPLAFIPSGQGYYTGGVLGNQYVVVDGSAGIYSQGAVARRVYRYDFSNTASPARIDEMTANGFVDNSETNASVNDGLMCNGKIWFPSSGSVWDASTNLWSSMPVPPVTCRYRPLLGTIGSTLYFLGGTTIVREPLYQNNPGPVQNQPEDVPYKKEVWAFDTNAGTWSRKADLPYALAARMVGPWTSSGKQMTDPNFRKRLLVQSAAGKLYVFDAWGKILQYDPTADAWATLNNAVSTHFSISGMASDGSAIWVASDLDLPTSYGQSKARADLSLPGTLSIDGRLLYRFTPPEGSTGGGSSGGLVDSSSYNRPGDVSGTGAASTNQKRFGTGSLLVTATADSGATVPASADFEFAENQPFTIEGWIYFSSDAEGKATLLSRSTTSSTTQGFSFFKDGAVLTFRFYSNGADLNLNGDFTPLTGQWYHIAVDREAGGTMRLYLDGAVKATNNFPYKFQASPADLGIGHMTNGDNFSHDGFIDEVRISNVARYAGAFTPSSAAFVSDANTLLLCHMDGA